MQIVAVRSNASNNAAQISYKLRASRRNGQKDGWRGVRPETTV